MALFDDDITVEPSIAPTQKRLFDPSSEADILRANVEISSKTTPDQAARLLDLEQKTGLPSDFIEKNLEYVSKESEKQGFDTDRFSKNSPLLTKWLTDNPNHYAAAKDDLANLSNLEWMIQAPQRAYAQGKLHKLLQEYRMHAVFGGELTAEQQIEVDEIKGKMRKRGYAEQTVFGEALTGGAEFMPQLVAQHLRGAIYAAPVAGAGGIAALLFPPAIPAIAPVTTAGVAAAYYYGLGEEGFRMEAAGAYDEMLDFRDSEGNPLDKDVARLAAISAGLLNSGLEMAQGRVLLKSIPGARKFMGTGLGRQLVRKALKSPTVMKALKELSLGYGKTLAQESLMEGAQRFIALVIEELAKTTGDFEHKTPKQILVESAEEVGQAAKSFAYVVAPGHLARTARNIGAARKAKTQKKFFEALGENATDSKLNERIPDKYQEVIENLTKDGPLENLYVSNEFFQTHWEKQGIDPLEIAKEMGIEKQYQESLETGVLVIPTKQYARHIAGTENNAAFALELSVIDVDEMNSREADEYLKSVEPDIEPAAFEESVTKVREDVRGQLEKIYPPEIADRQADLYMVRLRARAQRIGGDPWDLYQKRELGIGQEVIPGGVTLEQGTVPLSEVTIDVDAIEEETGRTMKVKEKADVALKNVDNNVNILQELMECLG